MDSLKKQMWRIASFIVLLVSVFLSACAAVTTGTLPPPVVASTAPWPTQVPIGTPLPQLTPQLILDPDKAIGYSFHLLLDRGEEKGFVYDSANYAPVEFPNGDRGALVAIGFSGPTRGYQLLYRIKRDQVTVVNLIKSRNDWGIRTLRQEQEPVNIESLDLLNNMNGYARPLLKVTGNNHYGTGLFTDGYFEIINITDGGIQVVFSGEELDIVAGSQGWYHQYQYQYVDLDGDGNKEIIKEGKECPNAFDGSEVKTTDCASVTHVYRFNGVEYVK